MQMITGAQLAERVGVSPPTLYSWIHEGVISVSEMVPFDKYKPDGKCFLFTEANAGAICDAHKAGGGINGLLQRAARIGLKLTARGKRRWGDLDQYRDSTTVPEPTPAPQVRKQEPETARIQGPISVPELAALCGVSSHSTVYHWISRGYISPDLEDNKFSPAYAKEIAEFYDNNRAPVGRGGRWHLFHYDPEIPTQGEISPTQGEISEKIALAASAARAKVEPFNGIKVPLLASAPEPEPIKAPEPEPIKAPEPKPVWHTRSHIASKCGVAVNTVAKWVTLGYLIPDGPRSSYSPERVNMWMEFFNANPDRATWASIFTKAPEPKPAPEPERAPEPKPAPEPERAPEPKPASNHTSFKGIPPLKLETPSFTLEVYPSYLQERATQMMMGIFNDESTHRKEDQYCVLVFPNGQRAVYSDPDVAQSMIQRVVASMFS